jgi:hypothetical protein
MDHDFDFYVPDEKMFGQTLGIYQKEILKCQ